MSENAKDSRRDSKDSLKKSREDSAQDSPRDSRAEANLANSRGLNAAQDSQNLNAPQDSQDSPSASNETPSEPRLRGVLVGLKGLSLGISIIVALLLGVGVGVGLKSLFGVFWVFWIGVFWGVAAAILNVYKAYKAQMREFAALENSPKYANHTR